MNASIRTQVTFSEKEVIEIIKKHLKKQGLNLTGNVSLMQGPQNLTICNIDDFAEPESKPANVQPSLTSYNDFGTSLQDHNRRPGY